MFGFARNNMQFTQVELKLLQKVLKLAADEFGNHGCNDFNGVKEADLTHEECVDLWRRIDLWNSGSEESHSDPTQFPDWCIMHFLSHRAKEMLNAEEAK